MATATAAVATVAATAVAAAVVAAAARAGAALAVFVAVLAEVVLVFLPQAPTETHRGDDEERLERERIERADEHGRASTHQEEIVEHQRAFARNRREQAAGRQPRRPGAPLPARLRPGARERAPGQVVVLLTKVKPGALRGRGLNA